MFSFVFKSLFWNNETSWLLYLPDDLLLLLVSSVPLHSTNLTTIYFIFSHISTVYCFITLSSVYFTYFFLLFVSNISVLIYLGVSFVFFYSFIIESIFYRSGYAIGIYHDFRYIQACFSQAILCLLLPISFLSLVILVFFLFLSLSLSLSSLPPPSSPSSSSSSSFFWLIELKFLFPPATLEVFFLIYF